MVHKTIPKNFNSRFEVVSCYVEHDGRILLLHRHNEKSQGGKWGVPAGKIYQGEESFEAMIRELLEETGLRVKPNQLDYLTKVFVNHGGYDFIYHMFRTKLEAEPPVTISSKEHQAFRWAIPQEALGMDLVDDLGECIKMFY